MPAAKLSGKISKDAEDALAPHAPELYRDPGRRVVAIVELRATERTEVVNDSEVGGTPVVKLAATALEIANPKQEDRLRRAMEALYIHRTAYNTLTQEGDLALSEETLDLLGGELHAVEAARLHADVRHWASKARDAARLTDPAAIRKAVRKIADGLEATERGRELTDDA